MMRAKKSLGQHFLKSERALRAIVAAGEVKPEDTILEIGPGQGVLTEKLLETGAKIVAVEKDDGLYELLQEKFANEIRSGKLEILHEDILDFDVSRFKDSKWKLVANIPYNITGAILKKFLGSEWQPERVVLLVQKEVAERIIARNGKESILSISVKAYGAPRHIERVLAGSFAPAPKVDSAVIVIGNISKEFFGNIEEQRFFEIVRAGFASKRKKLSSNLASIIKKEEVIDAFRKLGLDENARAEDIDIETWKKLAANLPKRQIVDKMGEIV